MQLQDLSGEWQVSKAGEDDWISASVPGCIHTDLMAAGRIPDPFFGDNEDRVSWVAETDWVYRQTFQADESLLKQDRVFLQCDGLDTLATITLNGEEIARTDNMHRRYEFDVSGKLRQGPNTIEIQFDSPVAYAAKRLDSAPLVRCPGHSIQGSPFVRKAMNHWGWDWGPKVPTSGIWRSIRLAGYSTARISDTRVKQTHGDGNVLLQVEVEVERFSARELQVAVRLTAPDGKTFEARAEPAGDESLARLEIKVDEPQLWWPKGYGPQPLYDLQVYLTDADSGQPYIDQQTLRIGLRTIELRQERDQWGKSFYFEVNGVPIFAKGANWIPADQFPSRVTDDQYRDLISSAASAHMNMLRVWGGGIYEDDRFFDLCDEYGIMAWQDFMFSCAHYPMFSDYLENVRLEAGDNVRRIRHHASLALWCGNNEMEWGVVNWWSSLEDNEERKQEYYKLFYEILPEVHAAEDSETTYWPSSPASEAPLDDPNGEPTGDGHFWQVWLGRQPFTIYRDKHFRFVSEFGFQSLPSMDTVKSFAEPKDWNVTSCVMEQHQKHQEGNGLLLHYLAANCRFPRDFPAMCYATQVVQAEAIRYGVEHWRRNRNGRRCMGALYWQLNDCWPVASWSSIEYNGRWKGLHYAARRFFAPLLLSVEETDSTANLHVTNDLLQPFEGKVRWSLEKLDGSVLKTGEIAVSVLAESDSLVAELDFGNLLDRDTRRETVLVYELWQGENLLSRGMTSFVPSKHLELPEAVISTEVRVKDGGLEIALAADKTARFVMLDVPGRNVRFSDNCFDLPAGRTAFVTIENPTSLTADEVAARIQVISLRDSY